MNMNINYRNKYLKYKNKYLELKNILYGGDYDDYDIAVIEFIKLNDYSSEIFSYFKYKFSQEVRRENFDEFIKFCLPNIKILMKFLYEKLSQESKHKETITIFSYATGTGIVESLFGLYLKIIHNKKVRLVYADPINNNDLINNYRIFNEPVINIYIGYLQVQIDRIKEQKANQALINMIKTTYSFDIFITNNPQEYIYDKIIDKYNSFDEFTTSNDYNYPIKSKQFEDLYYTRKIKNTKLKLIYDLINIVIQPEMQNKIPMCWLLWEPRFDISSLENIEKSLREILENDEYQRKWQITPNYAISTIIHINKIFTI